MRFPYTIVVTPPTAAELAAAAHTWWVWAAGLTIGIIGGAVLALAHRAQPIPSAAVALLQAGSTPAGATIMVDGRASGHTPAALTLPAGEHRVRLEADGYVGITRTLHLEAGDTIAVSEELWPRSPNAVRLHPVLPGAVVTDARFLTTGTLALTVALRPGDERQLWLRDQDGTLRRTGPSLARGPLVSGPDGRQTAYLAQQHHATTGTFGLGVRLDEVWLTNRDGAPGQPLFALDAAAASERLVDLSWAPDGRHLLVVSRQQQPDGSLRAHFLWLDTRANESRPRELLRLPGEVVPSSFSWSPDGRWAAFLMRADRRTALCLIGVETGAFRYLADLGGDTPGLLPFTPVAWSPNSRQLLYAAPTPDRAGQGLWPLGAKALPVHFLADPAEPGAGRPLSNAQGQAPTWRSDGAMLTLAQPKNGGPLTLRAIAPSGQIQDLTTLSLPAGTLAAVRWDVTHAQALVVMRRSTGLSLSLDQAAGQFDSWLVRFRPEGEEVTQ